MSGKFTFFENFKETADKLPDDLRLKFYDGLTDYVFKGVEPSDPVVNALVNAFKPSLDKVERRGGNNNPTGQNQYSRGQKEVKRGQKEIEIGQSGQSFQESKKIEDKKIEDKKKNKQKEKISFLDVIDWETLFAYWEDHKKGGRYGSAESRQRMLEKLKQLTDNDFEYAKQAICFSIDNKYQGFCNGNELYFKGKKQQWKTIEADKPNAYDEFSEAIAELKRRAQQ